ncbi:MAG: hypothetical protein V1834_04485 [Candidatus Micrarchaeota archaeon]
MRILASPQFSVASAKQVQPAASNKPIVPQSVNSAIGEGIGLGTGDGITVGVGDGNGDGLIVGDGTGLGTIDGEGDAIGEATRLGNGDATGEGITIEVGEATGCTVEAGCVISMQPARKTTKQRKTALK